MTKKTPTETANKDLVRNYYAMFGQSEWERLTWPEGRIEFAITANALKTHLPMPAHILDIGGGPGRWSVWLAQHGNTVALADLSPELLSIAQTKVSESNVTSRVREIVLADACDLSRWEDNTFDAVLCLGPFYHLTDEGERDRAAREIARVLRPSGVVFVAFMPIYSFLRRSLALVDEQHHLADDLFVDNLMQRGVFINDVAGRFNSGYGIRPAEVQPFMARYGFRQIELLADTGFATSQAQQLEALARTNLDAYNAAMDIIIRTANDPSLLGASVHLLYVGQLNK